MLSAHIGSIQGTLQSVLDRPTTAAGIASPKAAQDWKQVISRLENTLHAPGVDKPDAKGATENLVGLLRLQVDVSRVQMRVELLSKVAESAMASLRKFQQNQ